MLHKLKDSPNYRYDNGNYSFFIEQHPYYLRGQNRVGYYAYTGRWEFFNNLDEATSYLDGINGKIQRKIDKRGN